MFGVLLSFLIAARITWATPTDASAACTVTAFAGVASATAACTNIVLDNVAVPASETLDLSKLLDGTTVTFAGTTVGISFVVSLHCLIV